MLKHHLLSYLDQSMYFENMNNKDVAYRECISLSDCKIKYLESVREPTLKENKTIRELTAELDSMLRPYFKLYNIPWKFLMFEGTENNFPHTHADIIMLPMLILTSSRDQLLRTLVHEKVHIYQRLHPLETNRFITKHWRFTISSLQYSSEHKLKMFRSNPDINKIIYKDDNAKSILSVYKHDSKSLRDLEDHRDHPYEMMAYIIPKVIFKDSELDDDPLAYSISQWLIR